LYVVLIFKNLKVIFMKKIYLLFASLMLSGMLFSQTPLNTAVDFTATDVNGVSHTLFNYLNAGKYVCIMFTMNG